VFELIKIINVLNDAAINEYVCIALHCVMRIILFFLYKNVTLLITRRALLLLLLLW